MSTYYLRRMEGCAIDDEAWQVRVCDARGNTVGAGVLLGADIVLTCAHVVEAAADEDSAATGEALSVRIESVLCRPRWSASAKVIPGCWVSEHGTQRGDVALLRLGKPVTCHSGARLRKSPVRDVEVRLHGFPFSGSDRVGVIAEGKLVGSTYDGEWVEMHPHHGDRGQWVTSGFSGAGVIESGTGHVVGILVAVREASGQANAWMMPAATIAGYLPAVRPFVDGVDAVDEAFDHSAENTAAPPDTDVDLALRLEVRRLFGGTWSGTAVIAGAAGTPWLARLVATADPAVRQRMPDAVTSPDAALAIGAIDLALDAGGCTVREIREHIAGRFGLPGTDSGLLVDRLVHRRPPPAMVIDRVDSARDSRQLVSELLWPLAERARRHGVRLVLGFAGQPPGNLPYELLIGSQPVTGTASHRVGTEEVRRRVARLARKEDDLLDLHAEVSRLVAGAVRPPPCTAPWLRVRVAVAAAAELAAIDDHVGQSLARVGRAIDELGRLKREHERLRVILDVYWDRAESRFGAENPKLVQLHTAALEMLRAGPCDLDAARSAVDAYIDAVRGRADQNEPGVRP